MCSLCLICFLKKRARIHEGRRITLNRERESEREALTLYIERIIRLDIYREEIYFNLINFVHGRILVN